MPAGPVGAPATVNVLAGVFDRQGRMLGSSRQSGPPLPRQDSDRTLDYETLSRIDLGPGRYEVRAAVDDGRTARAGSVYSYVDVPDFARAPVSLSGLLLQAGSPSPAPILADVLAGIPTTRRTFAPGEALTAFVRVYQGLSRAMVPGYLTAEIRDERDQPVFHQESRILPQQFGAGRAMDFSLDVPTARLQAGAYLLTVEARHGNESARRETRFTIR
jgi:hypothetical protein